VPTLLIDLASSQTFLLTRNPIKVIGDILIALKTNHVLWNIESQKANEKSKFLLAGLIRVLLKHQFYWWTIIQ
jgi:hypothetical protein